MNKWLIVGLSFVCGCVNVDRDSPKVTGEVTVVITTNKVTPLGSDIPGIIRRKPDPKQVTYPQTNTVSWYVYSNVTHTVIVDDCPVASQTDARCFKVIKTVTIQPLATATNNSVTVEVSDFRE